MDSEIINKVAGSGLIEINLEEYYTPGERVLFDIAPCLFQGLILREKDFREFVKNHDWNQYKDKHVAITCSADAIVPTWAFMLVSSALSEIATTLVFGNLNDLDNVLFERSLSTLNVEEYKDAKVVIKGCSNLPVGTHAYVRLVELLRPVTKSIMYGEPCSTVPVYKRKG
jgi:hypothetical protein